MARGLDTLEYTGVMWITTLLLVSILFLSGLAYFEWRVRSVQRSVVSAFVKFASPGEDAATGRATPSELSLVVGEVGKVLGAEIAIQIQARLMQQAGVSKRMENQATEGIVQDLVNEQSPLMGAVLARFPSLRKMAAKHPDAALQVLGLVQGAMAGGQPGAGALGGGKNGDRTVQSRIKNNR